MLTVTGNTLSTVSSGIAKLRHVLTDSAGKDDIYGKAANGTIPVVVDIQNEVNSLVSQKVRD